MYDYNDNDSFQPHNHCMSTPIIIQVENAGNASWGTIGILFLMVLFAVGGILYYTGDYNHKKNNGVSNIDVPMMQWQSQTAIMMGDGMPVGVMHDGDEALVARHAAKNGFLIVGRSNGEDVIVKQKDVSLLGQKFGSNKLAL